MNNGVEQFRLKKLPSGEFSMQSVHEMETFHPVIGARQEAELLYLSQFSMTERCGTASSKPLVVWDVGLGAAGNAMHLINCWRQNPRRDLHLISFDLHDHALRFALRHHEENKEMFPWLQDWDWEKTIGEQGIKFRADEHELRWDWHLTDFPDLLTSSSVLAEPELIFYDAYSPAKCWRMWQLSHWRNIRQRCGDSCEIAFHSRATALRVTLLLAGFYVGLGSSIGEKEETTVAVTSLSMLDKPLDGKWLERVRRSTSAHPYVGHHYEQLPIKEEQFDLLLKHPQFYLK